MNTPVPSFSFDELFDQFVEDLQTRPANEAFEGFARQLFKSNGETLWVLQDNGFFSPSHKLFVQKQGGILLYAIKQKQYMTGNRLQDHLMFDEDVDAAVADKTNAFLVIPVAGKWVLQVVRSEGKNFGDKEIQMANALLGKFKIYGNVLLDCQTTLDEANGLIVTEPSATGLCERLKKYLNCGVIEFWCLKQNSDTTVIKEDSKTTTGDKVKDGETGAVAKVLSEKVMINEEHVGSIEGFCEAVDGPESVPFLGVSYVDAAQQVWAGVARKPAGRSKFSVVDEALFNAMLPFAVKVLCFAISPPQVDQQLDHFEQRLKALLEVAEILSGVLDIDLLLPTIMDRACQLLNAERCSLFLVDNAHHELVTRFHGGLDNAIHLKIGRGIVGSCAESGEIVNIKDAYADQRFDRSVDLATGFTTRSLLCIPIYNKEEKSLGSLK